MQVTVEVMGQEWTIESDALSDYMLGRVLGYGLKQALQDAYAPLTAKSGKTDADRLDAAQSRYDAIINDDRDSWREGSGGGKPLDPITEEVRRIVRKRAQSEKIFSTAAALDKAIVQNIGIVYGLLAVRTVSKQKDCSEKHAAKAYEGLIKAFMTQQMTADVEAATKSVNEAAAALQSEKEATAALIAELEAKLN